MKKLLSLALCLALLAACHPADEGKSKSVFAMDTVMEFTAYGPNAQEAVDAAGEEAARLNALLSATRPDSDIARANAAMGRSVEVSAETAQLLTQVLDRCADTGGALDVTIYPVMRAWGFDAKEYRVPSQGELDALLAGVDYAGVTIKGNTLTVPLGAELDLGAVGKGYAADRIVALWKELGVASGLLNLGGNVHCLGARPDGTDWNIGIRDPEDESAGFCTVSGRDMSVVTSGPYQRNFTQDGVTYHHIMDPSTGRPARSGALSVSVIGDSGLTCDALSTALFVMGPEKAADYWRERRDFDMVIYAEGGQVTYTSGLKDRLTLRAGLEGRMLT